MDFGDALNRRYSCRGFLDKEVPAELMSKILSQAQKAPSWGNTQPWKAYAAGGQVARDIRADLSAAFSGGTPESPDIAMPGNFEAAQLMDRYRVLGKALFEHLQIGRGDRDKRLAHYARNFDAFGAPALMFVTVPKKETSYVALDGGAFTALFCLAAANQGLDTIILAALARYPQVVRKHLPLGEEEDLLIGVAVGYGDPDAPANGFRSDRLSGETAHVLKGF